MKVRTLSLSVVTISNMVYSPEAVYALEKLKESAPNLLISCTNDKGQTCKVRLWAMDLDSCPELN